MILDSTVAIPTRGSSSAQTNFSRIMMLLRSVGRHVYASLQSYCTCLPDGLFRLDPQQKLFIAVGSTNEVKIRAVRNAFQQVFPTSILIVRGYSALSGVDSQPLGDEMTMKGARNRAIAAEADFRRDMCQAADFVVGIEGGVGESTGIREKMSKGADPLECFAYVAILHGASDTNLWSWARTASFPLPPGLTKEIRSGSELGTAVDKLYHRENTKYKEGVVGILSKGLLDRSKYYEHALLLALVPFLNVDDYGLTCRISALCR